MSNVLHPTSYWPWSLKCPKYGQHLRGMIGLHPLVNSNDSDGLASPLGLPHNPTDEVRMIRGVLGSFELGMKKVIIPAALSL